jgi:hypothetical protein
VGDNTPCLDQKAKEEYITDHLFNELRWLLHAATEWWIQDRLELNIVGYNVQVYAMDSAFLHARALFEFFVKDKNGNHYGCDVFLPLGNVLESDKYQKWTRPLHRHLMHIQTRSQPEQLESLSGEMKDLNKMPVDFASEILRLWKEFEKRLAESNKDGDLELHKLARGKRKEAIDGALCVVNSIVAKQHAQEKHRMLAPVFVFAD